VNPESPAPTDRHRRPGIATALKRAQIAWVAARGYRELVTSSVDGSAAMRTVNEKLGHVTRGVSIMVRAPLPLG
jgi:uncharacterized protein YecT (DUF1311 family)